VVIPTHEFTGTSTERLDFPVRLTLNVMRMKGEGDAVLTPPQITGAIQKPIGRRFARAGGGQEQTRVSPRRYDPRDSGLTAIAPLILAVESRGHQRRDILFLGAFATHRP